MGSDTTRASEHPSNVWEAHRQHFTQLYRDEKRKLAEVVQIMSTSERQYKRKIKQWKLEKHARAAEKERVLSSVARHARRLEKDCIYKIHGKDIASHKLRRYAKKNGLNSTEDVANPVHARSQHEFPSLAFLPQEKFGDMVFVDMYELAATITCLLWFETWTDVNNKPRARCIDTIPTSRFQKWTTTVLTTTGLSIRHILVATLFIYRLKMVSLSATGRAGSEYRVLTIALMLANKYLDDTTYTNKTWAEVSGLSVGEIRVMEIEFLTTMRHSLMVRESEMQDWIKQIGELQRYIHDTPLVSRDRPQLVPMSGVPSRPDMSLESSKEPGPSSPQTTPESLEIDQITLDNSSIDQATIDLSIQSGQQASVMLPQTAFESSWVGSIEKTTIDSAPQPIDLDLAACDIINTAEEPIEVEDLNMVDIIPMNIDTFNFSDLLPLPSVLTMEHQVPDWDPQDMFLQWCNISNSEIQDGPIPDLENWLDLSLWDVSQTPSGLTWQSVPLIEEDRPASMYSIVDVVPQEGEYTELCRDDYIKH